MGGGCKPQHTSIKQVTFHDCKIWTNITENNFVFPEYSSEYSEFLNKSDVGFALSGGSFRAATLALGTLRGLHLLGLLSTTKYISSNSGSAWVVTPLCFHQENLSTFLDPYLPPQKCTSDNLKQCNPNGHSFSLCRSKGIPIILKELVDGLTRRNQADSRGFWSQAIGQIFFKKYNLNFYDRIPVLSGQHQSEVYKRTGFSLSKMLPCNLNIVPYPIITASVVIDGPLLFAPVEFTPLYYGFPSYFKSHENDSNNSSGGYYIEPFGFISNSKSTKEQQQQVLPSQSSSSSSSLLSHSIYRIPKPSKYISISDIAGISSSCHTQLLADKINTQTANALNLSVYPILNPYNLQINSSIFCDGAGVDNTAIQSLIRRKITKIISMFAMDQPLMNPNIDHSNYSVSNFAFVAGLFGLMKLNISSSSDEITMKSFNQRLHIFPSEDYERLVNGLKQRYLEGKPCSYLLHTTVLSNHCVGIIGGFEVDILFIVNAPSDNWVNQLPLNIKKKVLKQRKEVDDLLNQQNEYNDDKEEDNDKIKEQNKKDMISLNEIQSFVQQIPQKFEEDSEQFQKIINDMFIETNLNSFPYISTLSTDFSIQLVNLLTNLMCWEVIESKDLIEQLYGKEIPFPSTKISVVEEMK